MGVFMKYASFLKYRPSINGKIGNTFQNLEFFLTSGLLFRIFITSTDKPKLYVMNRRLILLVQAFTISGILFFNSVYSQNLKSNVRYQNEFWKVWSINVNAGLNSFHGDLSSFDNSYFEKLANESGPAIGIQVNKHIDRVFSISGQVLMGKLKGSAANASFKSNILEYNLHLRINVLGLFFPKNSTKYGLNGFVGIGQFWFDSEQQRYNEGNITTYTHSARVPELVYFFGGGIYYNISDNFGVTVDLSIRQCQNDKLDVEADNNDFDYYSYLGFGIIYYFHSFKKGPVKNKARIAHNNKKKKSLHH